MQQDVIDLVLAEPPFENGERLESALTAVVSADEIDPQADLLCVRMDVEIASINGVARQAWKATWCGRDEQERQLAVARLAELQQVRQQRRQLYSFGLDCIAKLRSKHIESLEWAIDREARGHGEGVESLQADGFCGSFFVELPDGAEVIPYRIRDAGTGRRSFKVSRGGNKSADAISVFNEDDLRRYVLALGYRVRCKTRDGSRAGLYTASKPNCVSERH